MKILESIFEIIYLISGLAISIFILVKSNKRLSFILFGIMGLTLVIGDSFHLVPRIIDAWKLSDENIVKYLGIGKLVTSISMTFFYLILYFFLKIRYQKHPPLYLGFCIYALTLIRIALCVLPQNEWLIENSSYLWGIYRNIPFILLGIVIVILSLQWCKNDPHFIFLYLAISLSFIFYILTFTLASKYPKMGMMMIPKTICYVWILIMGLLACKKEAK